MRRPCLILFCIAVLTGCSGSIQDILPETRIITHHTDLGVLNVFQMWDFGEYYTYMTWTTADGEVLTIAVDGDDYKCRKAAIIEDSVDGALIISLNDINRMKFWPQSRTASRIR